MVPQAGRNLGFGGSPAYATLTFRTDPVYGEVGVMAVPGPSKQPYNVLAHGGSNTLAIAKGDTVAYAVAMRATNALEGKTLVSAFIERKVPTWSSVGQWSGSPDQGWRCVWLIGEAKEDFAPGTVNVSVHLGAVKQTVELGPMAAWNLGRVTESSVLPYNPSTYPGRAANAPWRTEANRRIERIRKGDLTVRVQTADGKVVPNALVHVKLTRNAFEFGSFCEYPAVDLGPDGERYRTWFKRLFNKGTAPMYWADWGWPSERERYLGICEFLQRSGIPIKGHPMIYPGGQFLPTSLKALAKDPPAMRAEMYRHMAEKVADVKRFNFVSWDVLNELRDLHDLPAVFGSDQIYADIFQETKRLDPKPTRYLNENTILTNGGNTESQQSEYERQLRDLIQRGAPLQGIGLQGHFGDAMTAPERMWEILDRFHRFKLPIQITEFDLPIRDAAAQADFTRDFLTAMYAHEAVTGVTIWGFWEGQMWQPAGALIDRKWNLRPNGRAWLDLVERKWATDARLTTARDGKTKVRGYTGRYTVTVTNGRRTGRGEVKLGREGKTLVVTVR